MSELLSTYHCRAIFDEYLDGATDPAIEVEFDVHAVSLADADLLAREKLEGMTSGDENNGLFSFYDNLSLGDLMVYKMIAERHC